MYECRGRQDAESGLFEPQDFSRSCASCARDISASVHVIARLAALVPRPKPHLVRYHGLFAPNAHGCAGAAKHKDVRERPMHASEGASWRALRQRPKRARAMDAHLMLAVRR